MRDQEEITKLSKYNYEKYQNATFDAGRLNRHLNVFSGGFLKNNLRTYFCIKTSDTTSSSEWPSGSYCILRYGGHCPSGRA